jgi:HPt (histidine-containing phosphotransfer) domain-containing protein
LDESVHNNEYIKVDEALSRVGGNKSLYLKLLGRFIEGSHMEELEASIQARDLDGAARQTHTLKGVSANLSLIKISALSIELEQLLKNDGDYTACLSDLKHAYEITVSKIEELI